MIRWERTAVPSDNQAVKWAKEITDYVNKIYPDVHLMVFEPRFGKLNRISWVADLESLAALDTYQTTISEDEGYQKMFVDGGEHFVHGSIYDDVKETL